MNILVLVNIASLLGCTVHLLSLVSHLPVGFWSRRRREGPRERGTWMRWPAAMVLMLGSPPSPWCLCSILLLPYGAHDWFSFFLMVLVLKSPEKKGDGVGKIARPHGILQVVDEQHRSVQHVASPSPHLGARTRVVDEIVDGSILSLWRDRGKTTASADHCTCP